MDLCGPSQRELHPPHHQCWRQLPQAQASAGLKGPQGPPEPAAPHQISAAPAQVRALACTSRKQPQEWLLPATALQGFCCAAEWLLPSCPAVLAPYGTWEEVSTCDAQVWSVLGDDWILELPQLSLPSVAVLLSLNTASQRCRWAPHLQLNAVNDGDIVFMHQQTRNNREALGTDFKHHYYTPGGSDRLGAALLSSQ